MKWTAEHALHQFIIIQRYVTACLHHCDCVALMFNLQLKFPVSVFIVSQQTQAAKKSDV